MTTMTINKINNLKNFSYDRYYDTAIPSQDIFYLYQRITFHYDNYDNYDKLIKSITYIYAYHDNAMTTILSQLHFFHHSTSQILYHIVVQNVFLEYFCHQNDKAPDVYL